MPHCGVTHTLNEAASAPPHGRFHALSCWLAQWHCGVPRNLVEATLAFLHGQVHTPVWWLAHGIVCCLVQSLVGCLAPSSRQHQRLRMVAAAPHRAGFHAALWGDLPSMRQPQRWLAHGIVCCLVQESCVEPCALVEAASAPSHGRCRAASSWLSCRMVGLLIPSLRQPRLLLMIGARPHNGGLQMALWGASHPRRGNLGIPSWQVPHAIVVACTWHSLLPCARSCVVPCSLVEAASAPSHGRCRAASSWLSCRIVG